MRIQGDISVNGGCDIGTTVDTCWISSTVSARIASASASVQYHSNMVNSS